MIKNKLKPKEEELVLGSWVVGGMVVSEAFVCDVWFDEPEVVMGGILLVDSDVTLGAGGELCSLDGRRVWDLAVAGGCISAGCNSDDFFILGGVGGMGFVGGVGDCMSKSPFYLIVIYKFRDR